MKGEIEVSGLISALTFANAFAINLDQTDFDDAIVGKVCPGRFQVDENEGFRS